MKVGGGLHNIDIVYCVNCHYCCGIYCIFVGTSCNMNSFTCSHFLILPSPMAFFLPLYSTSSRKEKKISLVFPIWSNCWKVCSLSCCSFIVTEWLLLKLYFWSRRQPLFFFLSWDFIMPACLRSGNSFCRSSKPSHDYTWKDERVIFVFD